MTSNEWGISIQCSKPLEIERMKYIHSTDGMNDWDRGFSFSFSFRQTCIHVWLSVYDTLSLQTHAMTPLSQTTSFRRSPLWDVCPYRDSDSCSGWGGMRDDALQHLLQHPFIFLLFLYHYLSVVYFLSEEGKIQLSSGMSCCVVHTCLYGLEKLRFYTSLD